MGLICLGLPGGSKPLFCDLPIPLHDLNPWSNSLDKHYEGGMTQRLTRNYPIDLYVLVMVECRLQKYLCVKTREIVYLFLEQFWAFLLPLLQRLHGREVS